MNINCPGCGKDSNRTIYRLDSVPVNSCLVMEDRARALEFPTGDIDLRYCDYCGFIYNSAFDPRLTRYETGYEEAQGYSPTFVEYEQALVEELVQRHSLHDKTILEIGCGKGDFLGQLCRAGNNRGIGFDPTFDRLRFGDDSKDISFVSDFYSPAYRHYQADFFCCKMTFEHIAETGRFLAMLRDALGDNPDRGVFFQVPNARRIIEKHAFEDIYYEHCSYFTDRSLAYLFEVNRFEVQAISPRFDDQYLTIEASPAVGKTVAEVDVKNLREFSTAIDRFAAGVASARATWTERLSSLHESSQRFVIWGGGSKAVALLAALPAPGLVEYVVDINPYRQNTFLPSSGTPVVSPEFLLDYRPHTVLVANPIYRREIREMLAGLGLFPQIV